MKCARLGVVALQDRKLHIKSSDTHARPINYLAYQS